MPTGVKHLVQCRCVLPQFKHAHKPIQHQFVVFSVINDEGNVESKFAQCPNCGLIHKVVDVNNSEIMHGRENMGALITIDDVKLS